MKDTGPAFLSVCWNPEKESDHRAGGGDWVGHMGLRGLSKHSDKGAPLCCAWAVLTGSLSAHRCWF